MRQKSQGTSHLVKGKMKTTVTDSPGGFAGRLLWNGLLRSFHLPSPVFHLRFALRLLPCAFLLLPSSAGLPLPDHVVYGTIAFGVRPVTRADTDVVVEARRSLNGPVLASYRMGQTPRLGEHFYELRVRLEEEVSASPGAVVLGDTLLILVRTPRGLQHQALHVIHDAGTAQRLDFGATPDTDGNGAPDGWELASFGSTGGDLTRDSDGDKATDHEEYIAGTSPTRPEDAFRLAIQVEGETLVVSLRALAAAGVGYEGRQRYYALESADAPAGPWRLVENHSRIPGANQLVRHLTPGVTNAPAFFRARVWLEGP